MFTFFIPALFAFSGVNCWQKAFPSRSRLDQSINWYIRGTSRLFPSLSVFFNATFNLIKLDEKVSRFSPGMIDSSNTWRKRRKVFSSDIEHGLVRGRKTDGERRKRRTNDINVHSYTPTSRIMWDSLASPVLLITCQLRAYYSSQRRYNSLHSYHAALDKKN